MPWHPADGTWIDDAAGTGADIRRRDGEPKGCDRGKPPRAHVWSEKEGRWVAEAVPGLTGEQGKPAGAARGIPPLLVGTPGTVRKSEDEARRERSAQRTRSKVWDEESGERVSLEEQPSGAMIKAGNRPAQTRPDDSGPLIRHGLP